VQDYALVAQTAAEMISGDAREVVGALRERMRALSRQERYEDAGAVRDRLLHLVRAAARAQRIAPLARSAEVVAARRAPAGGWELVCVRYGRLAGTTVSPPGADPRPFIEALAKTAEVVAAPTAPVPAATAEETEKVLRWLEAPGVRMVSIEGEWTCPVHGAGGVRERLEPLAAARRDLVGFDEPSSMGLVHRPPAAVPYAS
jgi:DNA polymerase-3 subunit epsilon